MRRIFPDRHFFFFSFFPPVNCEELPAEGEGVGDGICCLERQAGH